MIHRHNIPKRAQKLALELLVAASLLAGGLKDSFAAIIFWTNTAGGNWSAAANWNPNTVPSSNDSAVVTNNGTYTVTVDSSVTVAGLTIGGTSGLQTVTVGPNTLTLNGTCALRVTGSLNTSSGTITGTGSITNGGTLNFILSTINTPITNSGALVGFSSTINGAYTSLPGSLMSLRDVIGPDPAITSFALGFTNNGTIEFANGGSGRTPGLGIVTGTLVNGAGGTINMNWGSHFSPILDNRGTINIGVSTTIFGTGTNFNSGTINLAAPLTWNMSGSGPVFTNTGLLNLTGGSLNFNQQGDGIFATSGTIQLTNTTALNINSGNFSFLGGSLAGGALDFNSAIVNGPGTITNGVGLASSVSHTTMNAPFVNLGTITVSDGTFNGAYTSGPSSVVSVVDSIGADPAITTFANGFTNYGTIQMINGGSGRRPGFSVTSGTLVNDVSGTINFVVSSLFFGTLDNRGLISAQAQASISSAGANFNSGTITTAGGNLSITFNAFGATWNNSGSFILTNGNCTVTMLSDSSFTDSGGISVASSDAFTVNGGNFIYRAGSVTGAGAFNLNTTATAINPALTAAEYFWDVDPGQGNGTNVNITTGQTLIATDIPPLNVDVTHLAAGLHALGFRVKDTLGRWGDIAWEPIQVQDPASLIAAVTNFPAVDTNKLITGAEYFWDTDPGVGSGTPILVPPGETYTPGAGGIPPLSVLSPPSLGTHMLGMRVKDASGTWSSALWTGVSLDETTTFTKISTGNVVTNGGGFEGVAAVDIDGDGLPDLFAGNFGGPNILYRNLGNGTFGRLTNGILGSLPGNVETYSGSWGDFNNDGKLDLITANFASQNILYQNLGGTNFSVVANTPMALEPGNSGSRVAIWGDYDNDGWVDLFVANGNVVQGNFLYHNNGDGTFTKVTIGALVANGGGSFGAAWGDYDNDGRLDLFVANQAGPGVNLLYHNEGNGVFTRITNSVVTLGSDSRGCAWGDYDGDGYLDLFVANKSGVNFLYHNNGNGTFTMVTNGAIATDVGNSVGATWGDYDNDGYLDLFVANDDGNNNLLYHNNGDGTFTRVTVGPMVSDGGESRSAVWADFNNDGFLDLFVGNEGSPGNNFLYMNNTNGYRWLKVSLVGGLSNRSAIGAKIRARATINGISRWQMREISGGGFGQSDLVQSIGLGNATNVDQLRIEWPSGLVTTLSNVAPNQTLKLVESATVAAAVRGRGTVTVSSSNAPVFVGEQVTLTATPINGFYTFLKWSDGNTSASRAVTVGVSNNFYTAIFTNTVPLETVVFKQWETDFGGNGNDEIRGLQATADGGFVFGGVTQSGVNGNKTATNFGAGDFWLVKVDGLGNKQWEHTYGGTGEEYLYTLKATTDGGFLLGGTSTSGVGGDKTTGAFGGLDAWVVKVDANGIKQWDQTFGGTGDDYFLTAEQTSDGGYLLGGQSSSSPSGNKTSPNRGGVDMFLVRVDANGNKLWEKSYGGSSDDWAEDIHATTDGGFIVGGGTTSGADGTKKTGTAGGNDVWILKLDANGDEMWEQDFGAGGSDYLSEIQPTPDGGYVVAGIFNFGTDGNGWLFKLDSLGNKQWEQMFNGGGNDQFTSVRLTDDGGYLAGGFSSSGVAGNKSGPNYGGFDYWLVRTDAQGNKLWDTTYGGNGDDIMLRSAFASDGAVLMAGSSLSGVSGTKTTPNFGAQDMWAVDALAREAPVGTPAVLVNGLFSSSNSFAIPATNNIQVTLQSSFPNGYIFYTLDGSTPTPGDDGTFQYVAPGSPAAPFLVTNTVLVTATAFSSDATGNLEADGVPVVISVVPVYGLTNTTLGGGTVNFAPADGLYLSNTVVMLTATPSNGWTFMGWQGAVSGPVNPTNLTMNSAQSVRAIFGTSLTTNAPTGGSITLDPPQGPYPFGSTVRLIGLPSSGQRFNRWFSNLTGPTNDPLDFLVVSNTPAISAFFTGVGGGFTVTTLLNGPGTVTRSPSANSYVNNTVVALTPVPDIGFKFANWSGDATGSANPLNVTVNGNKLFTANFTSSTPISNSPPTVTITNPVSNMTFTNPSVVSVSITAAGNNATIAQVGLFAGATQLVSLTNAPYNFSWTNPPVGTDVMTAVAMDSGGLVATSAPVTILVQTALPQVALTSPTNGNVFTTPANILVSAVASDADNSIAHVDLYSGTTLLKSIASPPYQFTLNNAGIGSYTFTAQAVDAFGPTVTSAPVNITVIAPPSTNAAVFQFTATNYSVNESNAFVTLVVTNAGDLGGLVNYSTVDGTAHGGSGFSGDYTTSQGSLTFSNHQTVANIVIPILDNNLTRPDIQFQVQLSFPSQGTTLGNPAVTTVTIHENDAGGASNSLLTVAFPSAPPATGGSLQVTLLPQAAGGQWRFGWDLGWRNSGDTVGNLQAGNYPLQFRNVPNFLAIPVTVAVAGTGTTFFTNQYVPTAGASGLGDTGSLTVNITPNAPTGSGWRFLGESSWRANHAAVTGLLPDSYSIEFEPVTGWSRPASEAVQITGGQGAVVTANYLFASSVPNGAATPVLVQPTSLITDYKDFPFGFNGQLQTDIGFGSGVVVRPNIVLTAAHTVFSDETLSYVNNAWWYFEEEAGAFQPEPLPARGWYILGGYATQRTNDIVNNGLAVDQSSPQSREDDVAALYFLTEAGRGGYGGYLASDVQPNPYLTGSNLKMAVGYPVDGSEFGQTVTPGEMYVVPQSPVPTAFVEATNDTYTANWFLDYPGNSGGAVYVQFSTPNGPYFYPAAVYLGTIGSGAQSVSVVRAINSDVVNMINLAASEGDAGTNNDGPIKLIAPFATASHPAYVQVLIGPPAAVQAGASWGLSGDAAFPAYVTNLTRAITNTSASLVFKPITGFGSPTLTATQLNAGVFNILSATYTQLASPPVLKLDPIQGLMVSGAAGASCRIDFRASLLSGQWQPVMTNTLGNGQTVVLPTPVSNRLSGFYRAVILNP